MWTKSVWVTLTSSEVVIGIDEWNLKRDFKSTHHYLRVPEKTIRLDYDKKNNNNRSFK